MQCEDDSSGDSECGVPSSEPCARPRPARARAQRPPPAPPASAPAPIRRRLAAAERLVDLMMPPGSMRDDVRFHARPRQLLAQTAESSASHGRDEHRGRARAVEARRAARPPFPRADADHAGRDAGEVIGEVMAEMEPDMRRIIACHDGAQFRRGRARRDDGLHHHPDGRQICEAGAHDGAGSGLARSDGR